MSSASKPSFWQKVFGALAAIGAALLVTVLVVNVVVDSVPKFIVNITKAFAFVEASTDLDYPRALNLFLLFALLGFWASAWALTEATKLIQFIIRAVLVASGLKPDKWPIGSELKLHWLWAIFPTAFLSAATCAMFAPA